MIGTALSQIYIRQYDTITLVCRSQPSGTTTILPLITRSLTIRLYGIIEFADLSGGVIAAQSTPFNQAISPLPVPLWWNLRHRKPLPRCATAKRCSSGRYGLSGTGPDENADLMLVGDKVMLGGGVTWHRGKRWRIESKI